MGLSRHARNELRLYRINLSDVEATIKDPAVRDVDDRGNARMHGSLGRPVTVGLSLLSLPEMTPTS